MFFFHTYQGKKAKEKKPIGLTWLPNTGNVKDTNIRPFLSFLLLMRQKKYVFTVIVSLIYFFSRTYLSIDFVKIYFPIESVIKISTLITHNSDKWPIFLYHCWEFSIMTLINNKNNHRQKGKYYYHRSYNNFTVNSWIFFKYTSFIVKEILSYLSTVVKSLAQSSEPSLLNLAKL